MNLEKVLDYLKNDKSDKDILEHLWIKFRTDYDKQDYYLGKMSLMHSWNYFISDLDGTFFRWVLQKEAVTAFVKYLKKQNYLELDLDNYYLFLKDLDYFTKLEKKAYNKEIEYFEYLNAWIYLLLKHKDLIDWNSYISFLIYSFKTKEKITPFRFSVNKIKEVLLNWWNFLFVSWAPSFVFDVYLDLLKKYISKNIWESYSNNVFWFWSNVFLNTLEYTPLWWRDHKKEFINLLKQKNIINKTLWWMGDTSSDFWISYSLDKWNEFYFVNPEKKVIDNFDNFSIDWINYHLIFERKDSIFEVDKNNIKFI